MATYRAVPLLLVLTACSSSSATSASASATPAPSTGATSPATAAATAATSSAPERRADLTGEQIAASLKSSGLKADGLTIYTEDNDPNKLLGRPGGYGAKVNWKVEGDECSVEAFSDVDGAKKRAEYIKKASAGAGIVGEMYVAVNESSRATIHCDHGVKPSEWKKIEAWFQKI